MRIIHIREKIFLIVAAFLFIIVSCDNREDYIPYAYVYFSVDLNINNNLATPGYSMLYPSEGYAGVIVYCEYYDYITPGNSIFHAFDAACTYEVSDTCSITNEGNSFYGLCPYCGTKYEFTTGAPIEGVAPYSLKSYEVSVINNKILVHN